MYVCLEIVSIENKVRKMVRYYCNSIQYIIQKLQFTHTNIQSITCPKIIEQFSH